MGLADLFKPKWKHSDVTVRMSAVRKLDATETSILENVVKNDGDDNVRRLALRKLGNANLLTELASEHLEGALRDLALERASSLWLSAALKDDIGDAQDAFDKLTEQGAIAEIAKRSPLEELREAALEKLVEPRALADVARQAREEDIRLSSVAAVEDQATLKSLALSGEHREVALAALRKLDTPEYLRAVAKQAKIKVVRSRAEKQRRSLKAPTEKPSTEGPSKQEKKEHRIARLILLCETMEKLSPEEANASPQDEPGTSRAHFEALAQEVTDDTSELQTRFDRACDTFEEKRESFLARIAERTRKRDELLKDAQEREALCDKVDALAEDAGNEALDALRQAWEELGAIPDGQEKNWEGRFQKTVERFHRRQRAWKERLAARTELESLAEEASQVVDKPRIDDAKKAIDGINRRWRKLAGTHGVDDELKGRFQTALDRMRTREDEERAEKEKKKEKNLDQLERMLVALSKFEETEDLKAAERILKDARATIRRPGPLPSKEAFIQVKDRFKTIERQVQKRVDELREASDWNRLFNVPKQEELCRQAEELTKVEDTKELVAKLRALQAEWKKVGAVPRTKSEELWTRFKAACDAAYGRCEGHFEELKKERGDNLARKQAICEEAESIADSTEWNNTTDRLKQLQRDWKTIGPVERKDSDAVWKRFRASCDAFFNRRKEYYKQLDLERAENMKIKLVLCEKAEAIADSSEWHDTAERLKELQEEWRGVGPVPRKHSDSVWRRFRKACDHFFARRDENLDGGRQGNLKRKLEMCDELEALLEQPSDKSSEEEGEEEAPLFETVLERWREWGSIGPIPFDEVESTDERFRKSIRNALVSFAEQLKGTDLDVGAIRGRKEKILSELEKLAQQTKESKERGALSKGDKGADIAEMLQEAMARNTFKEETDTSEQQRIDDHAVKLLQSWRRLPPLSEEDDSELETRVGVAFKGAVGRTLAEERDRMLERPQRGRKPARGRGRSKSKSDNRGAKGADSRRRAPAPQEAEQRAPTPKEGDDGTSAIAVPLEAEEAQTPDVSDDSAPTEAAPQQESEEAQTPDVSNDSEPAAAAPQESEAAQTTEESDDSAPPAAAPQESEEAQTSEAKEDTAAGEETPHESQKAPSDDTQPSSPPGEDTKT